MRIAVTGASGFIGRHVLSLLDSNGHEVRTLGRRPAGSHPFYEWEPENAEPPAESLSGVDAVIHLAGEPVVQRWTPEAKQRIRNSRVRGTRHLVQALSIQPKRPEVVICASAIGYYGSRGAEVLEENSKPGHGFLPEVCLEWEGAAMLAESLGIRVLRLRVGIALGTGGGALAKMLPPFRLGAGGPLGGGQQWMSWIHISDLTQLIQFGLHTRNLSGPVNAVAPAPVTNKEFTAALAHALGRPALIPVPAWGLKLLYGEMAEVLLGSQRVLPRKVQEAGFSFKFNHLQEALDELLP